MKPIFLISKKVDHYCKHFVMISEKKIISVDYTSIKIEDLEVAGSDNLEVAFLKEVEWYKEHWEMIETTKKIFDKFYIEIAQEINKSINS